MSALVHVRRPPAPLRATVRPPGSKSLTNRALLLAALARGTSHLRGGLDAEDSRLMLGALRTLGVAVRGPMEDLRVTGAAGPLRPPRDDLRLQVGTAGTVARFLTAALAAGDTRVTLDGSARMRERPMAQLLTPLAALGARFEHEGAHGALPLRVIPAGGLRGGTVGIRAPRSSQFVSALLLAAPLAAGPVRVEIEGELPARPYVDMTLDLLRRFGGRAAWDGPQALQAEPGPLHAVDLAVEPDASAASYALAAAAIYGGEVTIPGLGSASCQGDAAFAHVLAHMGAQVEQTADTTRVRGEGTLRGVDVSLAAMPDLALTLAVTALHARGPTRIRDVGVLRHHESDRLAVAERELTRLGARVTVHDDGLTIAPPPQGPRAGVRIPTYADHRVAMAFALAGDVTILDPGCTAKTYPGYFDELARLGLVEAGGPT